MKKLKIAIIETGGTIVSEGKSASQLTGYELGDKGIDSLLTAVFADRDVPFDITCIPLFNIGSSNITLQNWLDLSCCINNLKEDYDGFVITHGTDTLEETAFFLNLTIKTTKPVVITGAMRPSTAISADGPLNLLNALRLASSPLSQEKGVLVTLNGQIHSARDVSKTKTVAVETFASPVSGPLGYIVGDEIDFLTRSEKPHTLASCFEVASGALAKDYPKTALLYCCGDEDGMLLDCALKNGAQGIVLACSGNGSVPESLENVIDPYLESCVFVRSSRTGCGPVTEGASRWQKKGLIPCGTLNPQKARILLQLSLARFGVNKEKIQSVFKTY